MAPEQEVERFFLSYLKKTKWKNLLYAVGGYPRDQFLGLEADDLDIVVEKLDGAKLFTQFIKSDFPKEITEPYQLGAYPIWEITFKGNIQYDSIMYQTKDAVIQFADTMREVFPDVNSRQRNVEYASLREDIDRRDLSINSLLKNLTNGEFVDLTGVSKSDIENKILRPNPNVSPDEIFYADPLRLIRYARFHARFDATISDDVLDSIRRNAHRIQIVSNERIMEELKKIMLMGKLYQAIELMRNTGSLKYILPEVESLYGVKQPLKYHSEGCVYTHTILTLKNAPATIIGQLAALLHDIGKPDTVKEINGENTFHGHEGVGADIASEILYRLRLDSRTIEYVVKMVRNHMRPAFLAENISGKALRRFIRDVGDMIDCILDLSEADALGALPVRNGIPELRDRIKQIKLSPIKPIMKPVLNGHEVASVLNIPPSKKVGEILQYLLDVQDEYAEDNKELTKDEAIDLIVTQHKESRWDISL